MPHHCIHSSSSSVMGSANLGCVHDNKDYDEQPLNSKRDDLIILHSRESMSSSSLQQGGAKVAAMGSPWGCYYQYCNIHLQVWNH